MAESCDGLSTARTRSCTKEKADLNGSCTLREIWLHVLELSAYDNKPRGNHDFGSYI